jgi:hypothetical protein
MTAYKNISSYERRAFMRAATALALSAVDAHKSAAEIIHENWGDAEADRIVKAASNPGDSTMGFPSIPAWKVLPLLAPQSAAARLLEKALNVSLEPSGRPTPIFIAEGAPAPVVQMTTSANVLGPVKKLLIMTSLTSELQAVSANTAQQLIAQALAYAAEMSLDTALFSTNAPTAAAPAGILYNVTPITAAATGETLTNISEDVGNIAKAISSAGFNVDGMILATTPKLAANARTQVGPHFDYEILSSAAIPNGDVIGLVPHGLWTGYGGDDVRIEASREVTLHFEDTAPLPIIDGAGALAVPTRNAFQQDLIALKLRARAAWAVLPGAIASVTGANW